MKLRTLMKLGVTGLMFVFGASFAASDDKNYATQLELKNCGGYYIDAIYLQRKRGDSGNWVLMNEYPFNEPHMGNGQSFCIDLSNSPDFKSGDQARLKAHIAGGDTEKCDGTNYGESDKGRRKMQMAGTTKNNNGCQTLNYKSTRPTSQCKAVGSIHYEGPCS